MNRLPHIAVLFAAFLLVAADEKSTKAHPPADDKLTTVKLRLISKPSIESFKKGELLLFEGKANRQIHRAGPEHFRITNLSHPKKTPKLVFGKVKDSYTNQSKRLGTVYPYNMLWSGVQFYIAPTKNGILRFLRKQRYVTIGTALDLQPGLTYRLTWACWPVGATEAIETHCDFKLAADKKDEKETNSKDAEVKQRELKYFIHPEKVPNLKEKVIAYFKKLGGRVTVDEESPGKPVIKLSLGYISDVTDADLIHIKGFTKLQTLRLGGTGVTDAALVHLKGLTDLRELRLEETKVTDAGLVHLKGLSQLQILDLEKNKVTDAGLVHLKGLTTLHRLNLGNADVTDAGLAHLKGLTSLRMIWLEKTKVTDAGMVYIKRFTDLQKLSLDSTLVTDVGLLHLKGLTHLKYLNLNGTKTTMDGILDFHKAVPKCSIRKDRVNK